MKILNNFKSKLYIKVRNQKSLEFLKYLTKVGHIPSQGKIFELAFNERKILMYVPKIHLELAEAIIHFKSVSTDCEKIIEYFEKNSEVLLSRRFLDVGANQGLYTLALRTNSFDTLSVEGNHELANIIRINILLNESKTKSDVKNLWVTLDVKANYFKHESDFSLTNSVKKFGENEIFNKVTLVSLIREFNPSIVKLDLEGLDSEVILSIKTEDFINVDYLVIEQNNDDLITNKVEAHMKSMGFIKSLASNMLGELVDLKKPGLNNSHYTRI